MLLYSNPSLDPLPAVGATGQWVRSVHAGSQEPISYGTTAHYYWLEVAKQRLSTRPDRWLTIRLMRVVSGFQRRGTVGPARGDAGKPASGG